MEDTYDVRDEELMAIDLPQQAVDDEEDYFLRLCLEPWSDDDEAAQNQTGKFKLLIWS